MSTTARAALPLLAAAQSQKHVTHNEALTQLDAPRRNSWIATAHRRLEVPMMATPIS